MDPEPADAFGRSDLMGERSEQSGDAGMTGFGKRLPAMGAVPSMSISDETSPSLLSFPTAAVRRIARSAAPGIRFQNEALAAVHRVAQAFVCFATDRSIHELQGNIVLQGPRKKGKSAPGVKKTLGVEHVMKVMTSEVPSVASKISTLFPDLVPSEYRAQDIRLLEQMHEQTRRVANAGEQAAVPEQALEEQNLLGFGASADHQRTLKRNLSNASATSEGGSKKKPKMAAAKPAPGASLSGMFGRQSAAAAQDAAAFQEEAFREEEEAAGFLHDEAFGF